MIKRAVLVAMALASMALAGHPWAAEERNLLEKVSVSSSGDQMMVRLSFANPLTVPPPGFSLTKPARVALDFLATDSGLGSGTQAVGQGYLRSYNVAQAGQRMRVVFNLDRPAAYQTQIDGKDLVVVMKAAPEIDIATPVARVEQFAIAQPAAPRASLIKDIAFRRGKDGEGRVLVDLQDASAGIDIRRQGAGVIVEFTQAELPPNLARKLDVTDFGTPVTSVNTFRQGDRVRMMITGKGDWDHLAYQADGHFVVELRQIAKENAQLGSRERYTGERLSLRFRDYPVKEVLQAFSDFASFNIVISEAVGGTISLNLQDVPWDQALDIIMQQKGLDKKVEGNVVMIAPREEIISRNKVKTEAIEQQVPQDAVFQVNYLTADAAKKKLEEYLKFDPKSTGRGNKLMAESGSNKIFVKATEATLEDIRRVLKEIDLPPRQVMIEARIVEASDGFSRDLGVRLGINDNSTSRVAGQNNVVLRDMGANVSFPVAGGTLNFLLTNATQTRTLNLELSALEADGNGKIISSPRVLATNGEAAKIEDGQEIPYLQASSSGATSVSFKKATLSLDVTPTINADGKVGLEIKVNKDSPGAVVPGGVAINTKQVTTKVVVDNGGTVVIGGIYTESERFDESGIPLLRDIPGLGWLFKTRTISKQRTELLVFITPRIVNDQISLQ